MQVILWILLLAAAANACTPKAPATISSFTPAILSTLYGYDDCIGGINEFDTDEEYMEDLKKRNCTVVKGPDGKETTNVASATAIRFACKNIHLSWLDGMPIVFNFPLKDLPANEAVEVMLSDGTTVTPDCMLLGPADEANELDTLLILGQFGDGARDSVRPIRVSVVESIVLVAPDGEMDAVGLTYEDEGDMNYVMSSVRLSYARMWDVSEFSEGTQYPLWPLPSQVYPNTCEVLFPSTTHVIRMAFSGGVTLDGVTSVRPSSPAIFTLMTRSSQEEIPYLGLADLGKAESEDDSTEYTSDGDNYLDICLDLTDKNNILAEDLLVRLNCNSEEGSVLYPPKGNPYGCQSEEIILSKDGCHGYFIKYWTSK